MVGINVAQMIEVNNIGKELIERGWSQGSLLKITSAPKMYLAAEQSTLESVNTTNTAPNFLRWFVRQETFHEDDLFIIVSQPCDIQKPPVHEPYVEVMRAYKTNERSIIHEASRNSVRYFLLQRSLSESGAEEALIVESTIRLPLDKASLLHLTPLSNIQDKVVLRLFRNWLARRYDRPALDDDLVNAVQKPIVKAIDRLRPAHPLHDILDGIGEVLLLLQNDTSPYQVALLFLRKERSDSMSVSDEQAANLAEWVEGVLNKSGNAALIDWDILNTDEISLKDYTNALKLSLDQFSLHLDEHENR